MTREEINLIVFALLASPVCLTAELQDELRIILEENIEDSEKEDKKEKTFEEMLEECNNK